MTGSPTRIAVRALVLASLAIVLALWGGPGAVPPLQAQDLTPAPTANEVQTPTPVPPPAETPSAAPARTPAPTQPARPTPVPPPVQESGWSAPASLSSNYPTAYLPDIAADQAGHLYAVWDAQFEPRDGGWGDGIGFAMWDGTSWSPAIDIFGYEVYHLPAIAVDSQGRLHLIGQGWIGLGYSRAWAQQRPASAHSWSPPVDISAGYPRVYFNDIAVDSHDWIHVVFSDQAPDQKRKFENNQCVGEDCSWVFYTRSTDAGENWSIPVKISPAMASGARPMLAVDRQDNLYVVWSTEYYAQGDAFAPSATGLAYSLDGGTHWSQPETQLFDTSGVLGSADDPPEDYWLSVAVDSQGMVHIMTVGSGFRHLYRENVHSPWVEDAPPPLNLEGLAAGYGFRGIAMDSADNLHFVLPSSQPAGVKTLTGLFHTTWSKDTGWSEWKRATTNRRGKGTGIGSLVISGGNQLNVAWFEHLEESGGHLFSPMRGKIEIYFAHLATGSPAIPLRPLPTVPNSLPTQAPATPQPPIPTLPPVTPQPTTIPPGVFDPTVAPGTSDTSLGVLVGIVTAVLVVGLAATVTLLRRGKKRR